MSELEHELRMYGCSIRHDLENTRAELTAPDGEPHEFKATKDQPNATLQALRWAKVDEAARIAEAAEKRRQEAAAQATAEMERPVEQPEFETES